MLESWVIQKPKALAIDFQRVGGTNLWDTGSHNCGNNFAWSKVDQKIDHNTCFCLHAKCAPKAAQLQWLCEMVFHVLLIIMNVWFVFHKCGVFSVIIQNRRKKKKAKKWTDNLKLGKRPSSPRNFRHHHSILTFPPEKISQCLRRYYWIATMSTYVRSYVESCTMNS